MIYLALLRAVNVGGTNKIEMARLKKVFEQAGFTKVRTFIASGNVIFSSKSMDQAKLTGQIEAAIKAEFQSDVSVLLRDLGSIAKLTRALPAAWVNDADMKCDVMFLWKEQDRPGVVDQMPFNPEIEDLKYFPGAVVWRIDRTNMAKSRMLKLVGTKLHKQLTVRNPNTVRKIYALMLDAQT
jgi:uncharacterized protein (DUF1697 family)